MSAHYSDCLLSIVKIEDRQEVDPLSVQTYHHYMAAEDFAGYCGQSRADVLLLVGCSGFMVLYSAQIYISKYREGVVDSSPLIYPHIL